LVPIGFPPTIAPAPAFALALAPTLLLECPPGFRKGLLSPIGFCPDDSTG